MDLGFDPRSPCVCAGFCPGTSKSKSPKTCMSGELPTLTATSILGDVSRVNSRPLSAGTGCSQPLFCGGAYTHTRVFVCSSGLDA